MKIFLIVVVVILVGLYAIYFFMKRRAKKKLGKEDRMSLHDIQTEIARLEIALGEKAEKAQEAAVAKRDEYRIKKLTDLYIEELTILRKI